MEKTTETLERIGQALFGNTWANQLAAELQVQDKTMRHWLSTRDPIPAGIWREVEQLCRRNASVLLSLADALAGTAGGFQTQVGAMQRPAPRDRR